MPDTEYMDHKRQLLSLSNPFHYFSIHGNENQITCIEKKELYAIYVLFKTKPTLYVIESKYNVKNSLVDSSQHFKILLFSFNVQTD